MKRIGGVLCIVVVALVVGFGAVTYLKPGIWADKNDAIRALENQGFSQIQVLDKDIFFLWWNGCGEDDDASFELRALNPVGKKVEMTVCVGWPFKGATIRTP